MSISTIQHHPAKPATPALETAAPSTTKGVPSDQSKIKESTRQFESMMLRQILGESLKPAAIGKGPSMPGSEIYQSFVTDIVADNLSRSGMLGLSSLLQSQLAPTAVVHPVSQKPVL